MPAIDKLQQRPTFNTSLVKQAMQEARTDPAARQQLQTLVEQRAGDFEDHTQVDHVLQLLTELNKDCFEIVPNRQAGSIGVPEVLEARITKVTDEKRRVDLTPPPPPPPSYRRDPLNVTGKAPAGSLVEFYNASVPGRPALGSATADANGHFAYELTDETKFAFGDQIGVRLVGHDGTKGRALIVPTEPFLITNTETTYFTRTSGTPVDIRTDRTSTQAALDKKTDARAPFFQGALVDKSLTIPSEVEQPYTFTLAGRDDAVEPNSTITVKVGNEEFKTTVDDLGKFALKVRGVIPGERLKIEVRDINGHGVDIPARVPPVAFPAPQIAGAMVPQLDGIRLKFSAEASAAQFADAVPPGGALIVRNTRTGVVSELPADAKGRLDGVLKGIEPFDAFEIAVRDVNGHVSEQTELLVNMPKGVALAHTLDAKEPELASHFQAMCGPPVDVVVHGQKKPGGPFLPLPALPKVPPHAVLEVVKDGAVVQALRADGEGRLEGMIRGVHVGDALSFRLKDAGGRSFPTQIVGFVVPDGHVTSKVSAHVPPALAPLDAARVGTGTLTLDPAWLAPANVLVGSLVPKDFQQQHAVRSSIGGALLSAPEKHFMAEHFPELPLEGASLVVTQAQGRKTLTVNAGPGALSFGFDDTLGTLQPSIAATDLPRLKSALQATLAIVGAAYAQGKEPGDVGYDRALGAAKTLMFLLDRFAVQNPAEANAAKQVAVEVLGNKPFAFELSPRDVVPAHRAGGTAIEATSSSSMNLLQARTLAMGPIGHNAGLTGASRGPVDVSALSESVTFDGKTLTISAKGVIAPGDQLLVKAGDKVHTLTADKNGAVTGTLEIAAGTVVEIAQRGAKESNRDDRKLNPITRAVVVDKPILGEGHLVALDALVQRAPDARAVANAILKGGAVSGLPPGGSVSVVKDGNELARIAIDESGALTAKGIKGSAGDLVDVRVLDAAGRSFAPMVKGLVIGQDDSGRVKLDVDAMSLQAVIAEVGSGALALPAFPKKGPYGEQPTQEAYAELNPTWGPSSTLENEHGKYSTKAAFPEGLLPALAKGPENARMSMGNSVRIHALQWDTGDTILSANYYVENQRPEFKVRYDDRTGIATGSNGKPIAVPADLANLTTLLQTSIAFMGVAQKLGSEPGDGFYDLAARTAKSTLVVFDRLVQQNPTFKTEIMAALRAAVPATMPFDLAPVGNAPGTVQTPPTDRQPETKLAFWNAVLHGDAIEGTQRDTWRPRSTEVGSPGAFFGGSRFFTPTSSDSSSATTLPLYLRGR